MQQKHADELKKLRESLTEMEANWKRALADYQNLQKRTQQQQSMLAQIGCLQLVERILPALDHLQLAARHLNDSGLQMVVKQFQDALEAEGIQQIEASNVEFDPTLMECVELVPGEKNKVVSVITEGYRLEDKVIRPAQVHVGNGQKE